MPVRLRMLVPFLLMLVPALMPAPANAAFGRPPLVLLGIRAFADEYKLDNDLRLECPLKGSEADLALVVQGRKSTRDRALGSMEYWEVGSKDVGDITPVRPAQHYTLYSTGFTYVAPVKSFEVWHDQACDRYYLLARFPMPNDLQVEEAALWIAVQREPPWAMPPPDASLEIHEAPAPPEGLVGQYELFEQAAKAAMAPAAPDGMPGELVQLSVHFGRFAEQKRPGALALATWTAGTPFFSHMIQLRDGSGAEIATIPPETLEAHGTLLPQVQFVVDANGDGFDDVVVEGLGIGRESRTMLWTFAPAGQLKVLGLGSWWGCDAGIPEVPMEEHRGQMS
ncbi:MAG TPA: hypothetical protein VEI97_21060 [bacterium]|nr:hypothetical protein [bacterium]